MMKEKHIAVIQLILSLAAHIMTTCLAAFAEVSLWWAHVVTGLWVAVGLMMYNRGKRRGR